MAASDTGYLAHFLVAFEMESIFMSWKRNERQKNFIKIFMTFLKKWGRGRNKTSYYILPWTNRVTSGIWKGSGKSMGKAEYRLFSKLVTTFGCEEIGIQKIKKHFFCNICYILSRLMHITSLILHIYLETWRGAKLGIFTHFTFTHLPWCSQSMNSLLYVYSIQIPSWPQMWSHFFVLPPPKNFFCITPWWVFIFDLGISTKKGRVSTPAKSENLLEDQEKAGKIEIFWKKSGKSNGRKFLCM